MAAAGAGGPVGTAATGRPIAGGAAAGSLGRPRRAAGAVPRGRSRSSLTASPPLARGGGRPPLQVGLEDRHGRALVEPALLLAPAPREPRRGDLALGQRGGEALVEQVDPQAGGPQRVGEGAHALGLERVAALRPQREADDHQRRPLGRGGGRDRGDVVGLASAAPQGAAAEGEARADLAAGEADARLADVERQRRPRGPACRGRRPEASGGPRRSGLHRLGDDLGDGRERRLQAGGVLDARLGHVGPAAAAPAAALGQRLDDLAGLGAARARPTRRP